MVPIVTHVVTHVVSKDFSRHTSSQGELGSHWKCVVETKASIIMNVLVFPPQYPLWLAVSERVAEETKMSFLLSLRTSIATLSAEWQGTEKTPCFSHFY